MIRTDLLGLVDNLRLTPSRHSLQPLFEAISNALHAILATGRTDGLIRVELTRDPAQGQLVIETDDADSERSLPEITSVRVVDNGRGFDADNYESFLELGSRYKANIGGKGIGRLTWLKVFESASVESVYRADGVAWMRRFNFRLPEGVIDEFHEESQERESATSVTLSCARERFLPYLRLRASTVRNEIVRHFLSYLLATKPPRIEIVDGAELVAVSLDDLAGKTTTMFAVNEQDFTIDHLKIKSPVARQHALYYCANSRVVKAERLKGLPTSRIHDGDEDFFYQAYVSSDFLDANVNSERTGFLIEEESNLINEVSFTNLRSEVERKAEDFLRPFMTALLTAREDRITRVLDKRFPEYRYVRKRNHEDLERIPMNATDLEVEVAIADIHFRNQRTGRDLLNSVVDEMKNAASFDATSFADKFEERFEKLNDVNQAGLLSYLLFRRAIIELYEQVLRKSGNRFQLEAATHSLIFPMGKDHDTSKAYMEHNLWLIDERLTFANYIASDRAIKDHKILFHAEDRGEPDLAIYFNLGFSSDPIEGPLHNVVIVEFKRPGPLNRRDEDPYAQVQRYIQKIRIGLYNDDGRKVKAADKTRFYCFIVCDVDSEEVNRMVTLYQFKPLFDGEEGYFLYNEPLRAYVELVPFEKVLRDAKRNHKAFFERLGMLTEQ